MLREKAIIKGGRVAAILSALILLLSVTGLAQALDISSGTHDIDYTVTEPVFVYGGTVNLLEPGAVTVGSTGAVIDAGSSLDTALYVFGGTVNVEYAITVGTISVGSEGTFTVYGSGFHVNGAPVDVGSTPIPVGGVLTGMYADTSDINLTFVDAAMIVLAAVSDENVAPVAIAGQDGVIGPGGKLHPIYSSEQATTFVQGQASDPDDDPLEYRWLEGATVLLNWTAVSTPPQAYLDLSTVADFSVGDHILTLEVRETSGEMLEASDTMTLRVLAGVQITDATIPETSLGQTTTLTATFEGSDSTTYSAAIDWGGVGTVISEPSINGNTITGAFRYAYANAAYSVTLTITDDEVPANTDSLTAYAAVSEESTNGFVAGAGWFAEEEAPRDKAFFGFVCHSVWWSGSPVGQTRLRVGDMVFRSTEYEWLSVADDGSVAWFAGMGAVNGEGGYYFMVEAGEDATWITIFDEYDTGGLVPLGGGRIKIRSCKW